MKNGYLPWFYANYYTFLSFLDEIMGKRKVEINYKDKVVFFDTKDKVKVIIFNLLSLFRIETKETTTESKSLDCPFLLKYLMLVVVKTGGKTYAKFFFPKKYNKTKSIK